jgi:APA family basic amino acid/polyamine antiporter
VGNAAANFAGPAEILALLIGTLPAFLAALSFAEMASMIPASGSSYTYTYTVMGEFSAWVVGWDLCLEYMCAAAAVGVSWASYVGLFIELIFSTSIDHRLLSAPVSWNVTAQNFYLTGSWICLPGVLIILFLTALIVYDVGASSLVNSIIVIAKILILITFICAGIKYIDPKNYRPILPESEGGNTYGINGLLHATSNSFFAFIGFDAITTASREAKKESAKRLPLSILTSLSIAVVLYLGIASVMLGVVNYKDLNVPNPIGDVCKVIGMKWLEILVCIAAIFGLTSVIIVSLYGQSRIFYSMSKDGLLTPAFSKTNILKRKSPVNNTFISSTTTTTTTTIVNTIDGIETTVRVNAAIEEENKSDGSPVWASIITG